MESQRLSDVKNVVVSRSVCEIGLYAIWDIQLLMHPTRGLKGWGEADSQRGGDVVFFIKFDACLHIS